MTQARRLSPRNRPLLEFIPAAPVSAGIGFFEWLGLRYPDAGLGRYHESRQIWFYKSWVIETAPDSGHPSHDVILQRAAVDNLENLVACVLGQIGEIRINPALIVKIEETALGIAMENAGDFGCGQGFMCGCHRNFRDDDFTMAEDRTTWIPRARRIKAMLLAAGAVDYSPLLKACGKADFDEVRRLLDAGYPPNFSVYGYATALTEAIAGANAVGDTGVVRILLERGALPNLPRPFSTSMVGGGQVYPLSLALRSPECTALLLDAGADPAIEGDDGDRTPQVFMGGFQTQETASALFSRVDFGSVRGRYGATGAHLLNAKDLGLCRKFVTPQIANTPDFSGQTPLVSAISRLDLAKVRLLLELGADPRKISACWNHGGWMCGHLQIDVDPECRAPTLLHLLTPVQAALVGGDFQILEALLGLVGQPDKHALKLEWRTPERMIRFSHLETYGREEAIQRGLGTGLVPPEFLKRMEEDSLRMFAPRSIPGKGRVTLPSGHEIHGLSDEDSACLLHVLPLLADPAGRYPELVTSYDFRALAERAGAYAHLLAAFDAGRPLTAIEVLGFAANEIEAAGGATDRFAAVLTRISTAGKTDAECDTGELLAAIESAEEMLVRARERIPGTHVPKRDLVSDICAKASVEFDGGMARARRDSKATGEVDFDDFADALKENLSPGSTMDFGKLLQNARRAISLLDQECVELMCKV